MMTLQSSVLRSPSSAFTLLELLSVIAVIGILAALLFPTVGAARRSANRAKTKVQFTQWAAAIESFRGEYGYYPAFDASNLVNPPGQSTDASTSHRFHDILAGKRRSADPLPAYNAGALQNPEAQNRKLIAFHTFTDNDLTDAASPAPNLIRDAFDNTEIAVLVDKNLDGIIRIGGGGDYASLPAVASMTPSAADFPANGVRAGVIFYAPAPGATALQPEFILSWK